MHRILKNALKGVIFINNYNQRQNMSYVRLLHASPDAPPVDVYVNGRLIAKKLAYKQITNYLSVPPGTYKVDIYPAGQRMNPVISTDLSVMPNTVSTIAAVGNLADIDLLVIKEEYMPKINREKSYVRFVHLSPNAPAVDITLPDGTKLFENVAFTEYTDYIETEPGTYTLQVKPAGSNQVVLTVPNVKLMPGTINTAYAVGLVGEEPGLEAIFSTDKKY